MRDLTNNKIVVCGAGGFIGGHLVAKLKAEGARKLRAVDIRPLNTWEQFFPEVDNLVLDLQEPGNCREALNGCQEVFNLAADMGGMGFIENNKALCMLSVLINTNLLVAARDLGINRYFFSSSACVYSIEKQRTSDTPGLKEEDAYPAMPEDGYGWEKLFAERMCRHFREDFGLQTRVARYHNVYGPYGCWQGGREKAPAAICRKIASALLSGKHEIEVWGDGEQTRSFTYIDDCLKGTESIMYSDILEPLNVGSTELVTINQLIDIVEEIAGVRVKRNYKLDAPLGVRGRCSENSLIRKYLNWEPSTPLRTGMEKTYRWIYDELKKSR